MTGTLLPAAAAPEVVFENPHVVAADKPGGVLTVPSRLGAADARACFGRQLEEALGLRLWPVHRLDFEVSGLVLFAKSAEAHRIANAAFEARQVEKRYQALTEGAPLVTAFPTTFTWESLLVRGKRRSFEAPHGKLARTVATALGLVPAAGRLGPAQGQTEGPHAEGQGRPLQPPEHLVHFALAPETGRPHQLRVHLARAGFPVAGDTLYGASCPLVSRDVIALRSVSLAFVDAATRGALGLAGPLRVAGFGPDEGATLAPL